VDIKALPQVLLVERKHSPGEAKSQARKRPKNVGLAVTREFKENSTEERGDARLDQILMVRRRA
jgi:hypothetical protein